MLVLSVPRHETCRRSSNVLVPRLHPNLMRMPLVACATAVLLVSYSIPPALCSSILPATPTPDAMDHQLCYTCMSNIYKLAWKELKHIYKDPGEFTDNCDYGRGRDQRLVPVAQCSTVCVHLMEKIHLGAVTKFGHVRGCIESVLINGFNASIVENDRWMLVELGSDQCRTYNSRYLLQQSKATLHQTLRACVCYGDHCNGSTPPDFSNFAQRTPVEMSPQILLLACTFMLSSWS